MSSTQSTDSYESYLLKFREKVALVIANYESKEHPGLMDMDALFASLLLQGVDQTFFARRIELALENKTLPKLAALSADLQTYSLMKTQRLSKPTASSPIKGVVTLTPSALAAPLASLSLSPPIPPTPPPPAPSKGKGPFTRDNRIDSSHPVKPGSCPYCWLTRSLDLKHTLANCINKKVHDSASSNLTRSHTGLVTTFPQLEDDSVSSLTPFKAGPPSPFYYDSCASVSVTIDFHALENPTLLHTPELLGGMSVHPVSMTHVGSLPFLPHAISKCYYSPNGTHNLLSLGYFQKRGYSYHSVGLDAIHVLNPDHTSFEIAHLSENLLPQSALYPPPPPDTVAMVGPHFNHSLLYFYYYILHTKRFIFLFT
jgi:hypothetical protein